ncbi:MAG: SCP2 sterol-binding domain-containing protein [archaeon]|nr:SCP2 sterol-binding domain-containing protein [archaeon]
MDKDGLQVKIMHYIMMKSIEEIAKIDEDLEEDIAEMKDGSIQWKIGSEIKGYQEFKDGKYSWKTDSEIENPTVTMILEDVAFSKKFFNSEVDATSAYMAGQLKIEGQMKYSMAYGGIADYIGDYLEPMRKK